MKTIYKSAVNEIASPTVSGLVIANLDKQADAKIFIKSANTPDFRSNDHFLASVIKESDSDEMKVLAIWSLVCNYTYNAPPRSEHSHYLHDPIRLLTQFGYGYCDDINAVFSNLVRQVGIQTRMLKLDGHIVPEIFFDQSWHLLDASFQFYERDAQGRIVSLEKFQQEPELVHQAFRKSSISKLIKLFSSYSKQLSSYKEKNTAYRILRNQFIKYAEANATISDESLADRVSTLQEERFKMIYREAQHVEVSDWWDGHYSDHSAEMILKPGDKVFLKSMPLPEEHFMALLKPFSDKVIEAYLERNIIFNNQEIKFEWSYPVSKLELCFDSPDAMSPILSLPDLEKEEFIPKDKTKVNGYSYDFETDELIYRFKLRTANKVNVMRCRLRVQFFISSQAFPLGLNKPVVGELYISSAVNNHAGIELEFTTL